MQPNKSQHEKPAVEPLTERPPQRHAAPDRQPTMNKSRTFVKRGRSSTAAIVEELQSSCIPDADTADSLWKLCVRPS
jgi:hypothetical protein